jgi:signal transduction protein with GAF and PtsI domain
MEKITPETYDKHIKALMDISRAITSDLYLEDILKLIVMVTAKVTGVEICSLWLIDESVTPIKIRLKATQAIERTAIQGKRHGQKTWAGIHGRSTASSTG